MTHQYTAKEILKMFLEEVNDGGQPLESIKLAKEYFDRREKRVPEVPRLAPCSRGIGSHKQGELIDTFTPKKIDQIVGADKRVSDDPSKVKHSWSFLWNGKQCAIWDYYGHRWSIFGPKEAFEDLFGPDTFVFDR